MRQRKLIWQILPASLVMVLIAILAVSWYGSGALQHFFLEKSIADLESRAALIRAHVADILKENRIDNLQEFTRNAGRESQTRITLIDEKGVVLADSNEDPARMDNHKTRPEIMVAYDGEVGSTLRFSDTVKKEMLYVAVPLFEKGVFVEDKSGNLLGKTVIRLSVPHHTLQSTLAALEIKLLIAVVIIFVLTGLLTIYVSKNISRSVEEMTQNAEKFAGGDFSGRMSSTQKSSTSLELATLGAAMDNMANLLDEKINAIDTHRNQLETVFSSMNDSVIAIDRSERVMAINKAGARLLGVDRQKAQGRIVQEIVRNVNLQQQISHTLNSSESIEDEIVLQDNAGDHYLQTRIDTLTDGNNNSVGVLVVMNDVTRLRRLESLRRDFVANVSHELRTPITSIRGYVETLLDGALDSREDTERFLQVVLKQSTRLNAIIDDLLSLSRIEQESEDGIITKEEGTLCMVIESAVETCRHEADQREVELELNCSRNLTLMMNAALMEQAMVNLLVNGIKFSDIGSKIVINADFISLEDGEDEVCIQVRDNGIGISSEHLPRLFERFYRSDKARSRQMGGTGLGLAIVKHIIQAHDGRIEVESQEGVGTTFTIIMPHLTA